MSLKPHKINALNNFIAGWYLDDTSICDQLIQIHKDSPDKRKGDTAAGKGGTSAVDKSVKDSLDVTLHPSKVSKAYVDMLNDVGKEYIEKYPYSAMTVPWGITEPIALQHYKPGGGFKAWHFENDYSNDAIAMRHLAFMTYLNDVEDGGGTEFHYQDLTVKAEKGLTLIWPTPWNFTHKGHVSDTEEKYIVTGWYSAYSQEQIKKSTFT